MPTIFVSYSHMDRKWFDPNTPYALIPWLENSLRRDGVTLWYDRSDETGLQAGDQFEAAILDAIDAAQFALLLVSEAFFASTFIQEVELPRILGRADSEKNLPGSQRRSNHLTRGAITNAADFAHLSHLCFLHLQRPESRA